MNFKIGDKVKCIDNSMFQDIFTLNKVYEIISTEYGCNRVMDDNNRRKIAPLHRFVKVDCLKNKIAKIRKLIN